MALLNDDSAQGSEPLIRPKLEIAVVGLGSRGASLARALNASADWKLAALCDVNSPQANKLAEDLGGVPCFEAIDELLDSIEIQAVAIAAPLRARYGAVMTALRAGKHVLVEKPLGNNLERARELAAEADRNGLVLVVNEGHCWEPAAQKMQKLLANGALGEILFVDALRSETKQAGIGRDVFWDLAPDVLAVLDFVLPGGLNPPEVFAFGGDPLGTGRDCVGHINMRLPNDATVHLQVNNLGGGRCNELVIAGSRLVVAWDAMFHPDQLVIYESELSKQQQRRFPYWVDPERLHLQGEERPAYGHEQDVLGRVVHQLAQRIRHPIQDDPAHASNLRLLALLEAVTQSRHGLSGTVAATSSEGGFAEAAANRFADVRWSR